VWSDLRLFQLNIYDEYVFNAVALIRHLIDSETNNGTSLTQSSRHKSFQSLHGLARTDDKHNVMMYFSLWDLDPADALFYPALEQFDPPHGRLTVVRNRVVHWPGNGHAPAADYCAFFDCSAGIYYNNYNNNTAFV